MIDFYQVGKKITSYRKKYKLTQDDLADKLYVTRQLVSKWENGTGAPSLDMILELCKLFNTTFEELLCIDDEIIIEKKDIFYGHHRLFVVESIINGTMNINLIDNLYRFSPIERTMILKAIKENKINVNKNDLYPILTPSERKYLYDKEIIAL